MSTLEINNNEWKNSSLEDLSKHLQEEYFKFFNKLDELHKRNKSLFDKLRSWPLYTEWRPVNTFKDISLNRGLQNRLMAFRERLIWLYPEDEDYINTYYRLYMELEINPFTIKKSQDILDILNKKTLDK